MAATNNKTRWWHRHAAEMRSKGLVRRSLWAHPEDWPRIQEYVERVNEDRERIEQHRKEKTR